MMNKITNDKSLENKFYYFSKEGLLVFTKEYHLNRGYCCNNLCKHCPYKSKESERENKY